MMWPSRPVMRTDARDAAPSSIRRDRRARRGGSEPHARADHGGRARAARHGGGLRAPSSPRRRGSSAHLSGESDSFRITGGDGRCRSSRPTASACSTGACRTSFRTFVATIARRRFRSRRPSDVGAFASVPVVFSDGRFYGTLCAGSHDPKPDLGYRELRFLHVLARLVADVLEREELQLRANDLEQHRTRLEVEATASSALLCRRPGARLVHGRPFQGRGGLCRRGGAPARPGRARDGRRQSRGAPARHRQDRGARRGAPKAGAAHGLGVGDDAPPPGARRGDGGRCARPSPSGTDGSRRARALGRQRATRTDWRARRSRCASRITLVCDAYHAMTSDRPYRRALLGRGGPRRGARRTGNPVLPDRRPRPAGHTRRVASGG